MLFILFSCSSTYDGKYIELVNGSDKFNSKTGEFIRNFCGAELGSKTIKLHLTDLQIEKIANAAKESYKQSLIIDKATGEEVESVCVSSFPFELKLNSNGNTQVVGNHSCFGESLLKNAINDVIYEQPAVKKLENSRCRYW